MTTYLEPPLETLYHSGYRGLLRFCSIDGGYLLTLTVEKRDEDGRWQHLATERASSDLFAQEFEALVHRVAADGDFVLMSLPNFAIVDGEPTPLAESNETPKPFELRATLSVLLEHYFHDEERHFETSPVESGENHIFEHWVALLNWLNNERFTPETFIDQPPATRVPLWVTLLILSVTLPTLLCLPTFFAG